MKDVKFVDVLTYTTRRQKYIKTCPLSNLVFVSQSQCVDFRATDDAEFASLRLKMVQTVKG